MNNNYDVIIVGAGPAGCTAACQLSGKGLKILLIEKHHFPRDKICGDALSPDVVNQFKRIDPSLADRFLKFADKRSLSQVRVFAPNSKFVDIPFSQTQDPKSGAFTSKREFFDHFYFNEIKNLPDIEIIEGCQILKINEQENGLEIKTGKATFIAKFVLGADGANSIVSRQLSSNKINKKHHCAGVRQYYEGVEGFDKDGIELHFYDGLLPGYFWIFPLPNNQANVGLGMLSQKIGEQKVNLKEKLNEVIQSHPNIANRFKNAKAVDEVKGFGLPLGSRKVSCSGDHYLLLGDAASLIDPFTGEGIGNAIRSGRIAAEHLVLAFKKNRFDSDFNRKYDSEIYNRMGTELRIGKYLQKMMNYPKIFNFIVNKSHKNESFQMVLISMLNVVDIKKELRKPSFYFKLLFG